MLGIDKGLDGVSWALWILEENRAVASYKLVVNPICLSTVPTNTVLVCKIMHQSTFSKSRFIFE